MAEAARIWPLPAEPRSGGRHSHSSGRPCPLTSTAGTRMGRSPHLFRAGGNDMRLQDKIVVITGAGSGMGLAMATRFAAEGAKVIAGDWNADRLDAAVEDIRRSGGTIVGAQGNIADQAAANALVDLAVDTHGRIDVLVNNAGGM